MASIVKFKNHSGIPSTLATLQDLESLTQIFQIVLSDDNTLTLEQQCFNAALKACEDEEWSKIEGAKTPLSKIRNALGVDLFSACVDQGLVDAVSYMLKAHIAENFCGDKLKGVVHLAVRNGDKSSLEHLAPYTNLDRKDFEKRTPLHIAILFNCVEMVITLIKKQVFLNKLSRYPDVNSPFLVTPLTLAVILGNTRVIDLLMEKGTKLETTKTIGTLLHVAIHFNQITSLTHLLTQYFDEVAPCLEVFNEEQLTPLSYAAKKGDHAAIHILYQKGAGLDRKNYRGKTPVHYAAIENQEHTLSLLAYLGADFSILDKDYNPPINYAEGGTRKAFIANLVESQKQADKQPPNFFIRPPEILVFKGGGPKGIAYVGVLEELEKRHMLKDLRRVAGSSAGAITALLVALGYTAQEVGRLLTETSLVTFLDNPDPRLSQNHLLSVFKKLTSITSYLNPSNLKDIAKFFATLALQQGICEGEVARQWFEAQIKAKTGIEYCTFGELNTLIQKNSSLKHFHLFGTRIGNTQEIVHFSSEDPQCKNYIISDVVLISMCIPAVFKPHCIWIKREDGARMECPDLGSFVDGGVIFNLPIKAFDFRGFVQRGLPKEEQKIPEFNRRVLGFSLYSPEEKPPSLDPKITNSFQLLKGIVETYRHAESLLAQTEYDQHRIVPISNEGVGLLDFDLTEKDKHALIQSGKEAIDLFFSKYAEANALDKEYLKEKNLNFVENIHPDFFGREKEMAHMHQSFTTYQESMIPYLLYGESGVGKTEVAIAYAQKYREHYFLIYRLHCETHESLDKDYRAIAEKLHLNTVGKDFEGIRRMLFNHLSTASFEKPWLLIYDNVVSAIKMPERGGCILLTANDAEIYETAHKEMLHRFTEEETVHFLKERTKLIDEENVQAMKTLHQELEGLPLLIGFAAKRIQEMGGVKQFVQDFQDKKVLLKASSQRYSIPLETTWQMRLETLEKNYPLAYEWLCLCAYLSPEEIPKKWIDLWLEKVKKTDPTQAAQLSWELLAPLFKMRLVRHDSKTHMCSIHRLLQSLVLERVEHNASYKQEVSLLLKEAIQGFDTSDPKTWAGGKEWVAHATKAVENIGDVDKEVLATIYAFIGGVKVFMTEFKTGLKYQQEALEMRKALYPDQAHPDVAQSLNNVGAAHTLGDAKTGLKYFQEALEMRKALYPDQAHPAVAQSLNNVGGAYQALGDAKTGLKYQQEALEMRKALYPDQAHPDVALSLNSVGIAYWKLGDAKTGLK
ncbi:MAG: hypothetical protein K940chlam8_00493, partial [Chlamydiae bacterium]|nr:hypothetical protein [Chlamydiota bacterium]